MFLVSWVYLPLTWDHFAKHSLKQPAKADPDLGDCAGETGRNKSFIVSFMKSELTKQIVAIQLYNESVTVSLYSNMHD